MAAIFDATFHHHHHRNHPHYHHHHSHMRRVTHSSPSLTTTTNTNTRPTSASTTTTTTTPTSTAASLPHPIPILITTAPQTPSPAATPHSIHPTIADASSRIRKRLAPGLQARLRRFEEQNRDQEEAVRSQHIIGRIPEEQLAELERLERQRQQRREHQPSAAVTGRGKSWSSALPPAVAMPVGGGVRLSGGPVWTDNEISMPESGDDFSSVIDISEGDLAADTTEDDEALYFDKHKYRIPSPGKTRLNLLTKQPLSPSPRPVIGMRPSSPPPTVSQTTTPFPPMTPPRMDSNYALHRRTGSVETVSDSDWTGTSTSRAGSIYSLSRVSFTGQLSQLTSMRLPDATSLSKRILSMSSALEAARALSDAAEQIRMWISKAAEVLGGLDAEDDVEWAAAGGQEGIEDVDAAIKRFEQLVQVYILSIERLQTRPDITQLPRDDLTGVVRQMESIVTSWQTIKDTLKGIKNQVTIAIEWMRLWNTVLGEIGQEMEALNSLVFEMEEKRHSGAESLLGSRDSIGIDELETIVEDNPAGRRKALASANNNRLSIPAAFPNSPSQNPVPDKEDSSLLALFARMQPLRASLDFLPMRLSTFHVQGGPIFPTACQDLDQRREQLEEQYTKLDADAHSLRRELGEDKWLLVFRNAGRQALKMCDSIARSYTKLLDAVDVGEHQTNVPSIAKKIENYEAKKTHYGPAIERVLSIIDRGVQDRLTVNGEILRLQSDMRQRWDSLQADIREMDFVVEEFTLQTRDRELRDSVSTVVSSERSLASSLAESPGSSPASSVIGISRKNSFQGSRTPTPLMNAKVRSGSNTAKSTARPLSGSQPPRRSLLPRASIGSDLLPSPISSPSTSTSTPSKSTPVWPSRPDLLPSNRPRWNTAVKGDSRDFRSLSSQEPSPYAKSPATPKSTFLRSTPKPSTQTSSSILQRHIHTPSSLPRPTATPLHSPFQTRKISLPASSSVYTPSKLLGSRSSNPTLRPSSRLSSSLAAGHRHSANAAPSRVYRDGNDADTEAPAVRRPPSAMAVGGPGKRSSSLFSSARIRHRVDDAGGGGSSGAGSGNGHAAAIPAVPPIPALGHAAPQPGEGKPRWRV